MKVRFGRNDVLYTESIPELSGNIDELYENGPLGSWQSIEKLLLFTLLDQAKKMSSAEDQATIARLTGVDRQAIIDTINSNISSIGN